MKKNFLFTSESVSEGHPDKVCDRISDMVVDTYLSAEPQSRVACETLTTTNKVVLAGETRGPNINKDDLLKSGLWNYIRQKPFSKIPHYSSSPKSIFISAMPTEPFALDVNYLSKELKFIQKGIDSLKEIFDCPINFLE